KNSADLKMRSHSLQESKRVTNQEDMDSRKQKSNSVPPIVVREENTGVGKDSLSIEGKASQRGKYDRIGVNNNNEDEEIVKVNPVRLMEQRQNVISELFITEKDYLRDL